MLIPVGVISESDLVRVNEAMAHMIREICAPLQDGEDYHGPILYGPTDPLSLEYIFDEYVRDRQTIHVRIPFGPALVRGYEAPVRLHVRTKIEDLKDEKVRVGFQCDLVFAGDYLTNVNEMALIGKAVSFVSVLLTELDARAKTVFESVVVDA